MQHQKYTPNILTRTRLWYVLILLLSSVVLVRVFYLQVIQHDYYKTAALVGQFREYEIPASRGVIEAHNGDAVVPIVLNEPKFTLFVDPLNIESAEQTADAVLEVIPTLERDDVMESMEADSRYQVLRKKLTKPIAERIEALELPGVGIREEPYRTYPQGELAAHILGFVNDDGEGKYGIEQALDDVLQGTPGQLRAITDARGIPLAANRDNTLIEPQAGKRVRLTIDVSLQKQLEDILEAGLEHARSDSGGALIMNADTGQIKAMANYPTFEPGKFFDVSADEVEVFQNNLIASPLEIGSIMKPLTMAAALDQGVVSKSTTYHDPDQFTIDGATVYNVEESSGVGTRSMEDILQLSLNTGATWLLKQMGDGEVNERARVVWHQYMTEHFFFEDPTGVEQGYEAAGSIPSPTEGFGLNIQYANTAFGQGMTATPLQAVSALAAVINGGTYYQPRLVDALSNSDGEMEPSEPIVRKEGVVSSRVSSDLRDLMERAFAKNYRTYGMERLRDGFSIGGKTGTAQVPNPETGGYYDDRYNGTFMGYVSGDSETYVIIVRVDEPSIGGYAGSTAAGPVFVDLVEALIDSYGVQPKVN